MYMYIHVCMYYSRNFSSRNFSFWSFSHCSRSYRLFLRQPLPRPRAPPFPSTASFWPWPDRPMVAEFWFFSLSARHAARGTKKGKQRLRKQGADMYGKENCVRYQCIRPQRRRTPPSRLARSSLSRPPAPSWLILRPPCPRPHTTRLARALSFSHPPLPLSPQHHLLYTHSRRFAGTPDWTPSPHHPTRRAPAGRPARSFFVHTIPAHPLSRSCHPGSPQQPHADASTGSCTRSRRDSRMTLAHEHHSRASCFSSSSGTGTYALALVQLRVVLAP